MLKVTDKKRAAGTMDQQVKSMVYQICRLWDEMEDFERLFPRRLAEIPHPNQFNPVHAYKLEKQGKDTIQVWHVDLNWEKDRLLCEVKYTHQDVFLNGELALMG
mgnify:CR=1 FL=1